MSWIISKIRLFLLGAALLGPVLVYFGWSDVQRIRDIETNGVETTALIEGATRTKRRRGGESYSLKLAWRDKAGAVQKAEGVSVSSAFANQIISGDKITRASLRIKYVPGAGIDDKPIVLEDSGRQEEQDEFMMNLGFGLTGVGVVGSGLAFLIGRRRRDPEPAAPHA
jgi:hypothetical protein